MSVKGNLRFSVAVYKQTNLKPPLKPIADLRSGFSYRSNAMWALRFLGQHEKGILTRCVAGIPL